uniref:Uncharacterized protein n=1 Tax=Aegilops tauschii subsp. strangulata TaxID=200361 RepID=A0A453QC31_AEGTS
KECQGGWGCQVCLCSACAATCAPHNPTGRWSAHVLLEDVFAGHVFWCACSSYGTPLVASGHHCLWTDPLWAWAAAEGRCPDAIPAAGQQDSSCHVRSALSGRASCGKSDKHDLQLDGQEDGREQQEEV